MTRYILVIEDDPALLDLYQQLLADEGYQTSLHKTTFEDVADVERLHPDLVLLDVNVSHEHDGLTMLHNMRSSPSTSSLPVVLCTAACAETTRLQVEQVRQQGIPILYKPFELDDLLVAIEEALCPMQR